MSRKNANEIYDDIMKTYILPGAFEQWKEYRDRITDYVIRYTDAGKTVAIIGAGYSNDLDLRKLYDHFGNLTLLDIDDEALKSALSKYDLCDKDNIHCVEVDLFGASRDDYVKLIDLCWRDVKKMGQLWSPYVTAPKYIAAINEIYEKIARRTLDCGGNVYDYVVMIGVHSQLNAMFERIWNIILEATEKSDSCVAKCVDDANEKYIPRVNEAVLGITRERAFIGLEAKEIERECMVEGAKQAFEDIFRREEKSEIKLGETMHRDLWQLKVGVSYEMHILRIDKCI